MAPRAREHPAWDELDREQRAEAPPLTCRRCGAPVYLEALKGGRKRYVDAITLEPHYLRCAPG